MMQFLLAVGKPGQLTTLRFAYDGTDVLQFNYSSERFEPLHQAAQPFAQQFNQNPDMLRSYRRHKDYAPLITKTIVNVAQGLAAKPSVTIRTRRMTSSSEPLLLSCHVNGFYPRDINISWLLNGAALEQAHTSTTLPNADGTFQLMGHIGIVPRNGDTYTCQVEHSSSSDKLTANWESTVKLWPSGGYAIGIIFGIIGIICTVTGMVGRRLGHHARTNQNQRNAHSEGSSGITGAGSCAQAEAERLYGAGDRHPSPTDIDLSQC
ncbi:class II histocompatibility antigen, B-L beta chain-like isoform X2 [Stegostoma tigrinum]|nr:class II histocompatibility antigen, B-L beta chain-like isoform X2 [Stegostoma tigrinum]